MKFRVQALEINRALESYSILSILSDTMDIFVPQIGQFSQPLEMKQKWIESSIDFQCLDAKLHFQQGIWIIPPHIL